MGILILCLLRMTASNKEKIWRAILGTYTDWTLYIWWHVNNWKLKLTFCSMALEMSKGTHGGSCDQCKTEQDKYCAPTHPLGVTKLLNLYSLQRTPNLRVSEIFSKPVRIWEVGVVGQVRLVGDGTNNVIKSGVLLLQWCLPVLRLLANLTSLILGLNYTLSQSVPWSIIPFKMSDYMNSGLTEVCGFWSFFLRLGGSSLLTVDHPIGRLWYVTVVFPSSHQVICNITIEAAFGAHSKQWKYVENLLESWWNLLIRDKALSW